MAEPSPAQRLAQLRQRWERDPKSRIFLQLAEEYRRAGRLAEAVRVLESGLAAHPGYVAAQVVLGRCLLETGDAARAVSVLERAVSSDPTQIVAIRLLVDAYLEVENVAKARERLDLYRLLNDRDADIETLEARVGRIGGEVKPVLARGRNPRERSGEVALPATPGDEATPGVEAGAFAEAESVEAAYRPPAHGLPIEPRESAVVRPRSEHPFGRVRGEADARRIVAALAAGGIFPVRLRAAPPARPEPFASPAPPIAPEPPVAAMASSARPEEGPWTAGPAREIAPDPAVPQALGVEERSFVPSPEPFPEPSPEPEAWTPPVPREIGVATATLGSLYLSQGHLEDAARSFEAVLDQRPDDADALAGLAEVRRRQVAEEAAFFTEPADEVPTGVPPVAVGGLTSRKIALLRQFMARMKRGAQAHVS